MFDHEAFMHQLGLLDTPAWWNDCPKSCHFDITTWAWLSIVVALCCQVTKEWLSIVVALCCQVTKEWLSIVVELWDTWLFVVVAFRCQAVDELYPSWGVSLEGTEFEDTRNRMMHWTRR